MARRSSKREEPPPPKEWTLTAITRGIEKLQRRLDELNQLETDQVQFDDPKKEALESEIAATIENVFGTGSREHREHEYVSISPSGPVRIARFNEPRYITEQRNQSNFLKGIAETREMLAGLLRRLEEKKLDFRRCPKCNATYRDLDYCTQDGTPLVDLSYDPDAPTLR
jgi:hypothetical protein